MYVFQKVLVNPKKKSEQHINRSRHHHVILIVKLVKMLTFSSYSVMILIIPLKRHISEDKDIM